LSTGSRAQEFLELFNQLGHHLRRLLNEKPHTSHSEMLNKLAQRDAYVHGHLSELQAFRSLRNAIVHMPTADHSQGQPIAEPLPQVVKRYRELVAYIRQPPPVLERKVAVKQVFTVAWHDRVLPKLDEMYRHEFRLAPVLEHGNLAGVFSDTLLGRAWVQQRRLALDEDMTFAALREACCDPRVAAFDLLPKHATLQDVEACYQARFRERLPLTVVCITTHGRLGEPLLGIVTPHDLPHASGRN